MPRFTLIFVAIAFVALALAGETAAQQSNRPRNYCECIKSCEGGKERCERAFDEDCKRTPQPANCEPQVRQRCDQRAGLCNLDCGTAFRQTRC